MANRNDKFRLVSSGRLNGIQVSRGDILREKATNKTVKVLNVLIDDEMESLLSAEYNSPSSPGQIIQKNIKSFDFIS